MPRHLSRSCRARLWLQLAAILAASCVAAAASADIYDVAVEHHGRSTQDLTRDGLDHPAALLRLAHIHAGQHVLDMIGGDGYYSELASYVVGPTGHVVLFNDPSFERWAGDALSARLGKGRLPGVEHRVADWSRLSLGVNTFDAVLLVKVYHDLYWVNDDQKEWPKVPVKEVLDAVIAALKPGGTLLLIDHSAKKGSGSAAASSLHRIDEAFARKDFESRGLKVIAKSDILRNRADPRTQISYKPPMLGKTDRFVLVFRKG